MEKQVIEVQIEESTRQELASLDKRAGEIRVYKIETSDQYKNAAQFGVEMKAKFKEWDEKRDSLVRPLNELVKKINDFFRPTLTAMGDAEKTIKLGLIAYDREQARIAQEAQQKALAASRAEEDRKRAALEARAEKAEEKGKVEKADELRQQAQSIYVPTPVFQKEVPKVEGLSYTTEHKAEVLDFSKVPAAHYINDPKIQERIQAIMNKYAEVTKGSLPVDGVRFYTFQNPSLRAAKR